MPGSLAVEAVEAGAGAADSFAATAGDAASVRLLVAVAGSAVLVAETEGVEVLALVVAEAAPVALTGDVVAVDVVAFAPPKTIVEPADEADELALVAPLLTVVSVML